ncbi:Elongator subunit elp2 [Podila horticola]|nr:Elongator subunit elp2 [Podila horticola]
MEVTQEYISVGCNRLTQALAWGADGLAAFGAHHSVALYYPMDSSRRGVIATLHGHSARVNCVNFINRGHEMDKKNVAIVSGSADKTARIWKKRGDHWVCSAVLEGHTGSVVTIGVVRARSIVSDTDLIATGSGDGTIKIWEREEVDDSKDQVTCIQTIDVGKKYAQSIAISYLPNTTAPVMAVGSTDNRISIYAMQSKQFSKVLSLQGHDNWVRSLDFATFTKDGTNDNSTESGASNNSTHHHTLQDGDLLLASGSQDKYIRIWRISSVDTNEQTQEAQSGSEGALTQDMLKSLEEMSKSGTQLSTKAHIIEVAMEAAETKRFSVIFEALLLGHDDWVYTVNWQPATLLNGKYYQPMALLSASTDKSMMIWKPDETTGVWVNNTQVGEVGGNTIGFYGGLFGPDGRWILAYGYNGAFHIWKNEGNEIGDRWVPQVPASGHYASVQNLTWDPTNEYLVSVSLDQTARLFSPWKHTDNKTLEPVSTWHEIARPQIHGYDAQCVAFSSKWTFVSGSDEKVLRVFDAPQTFVHSLAQLTGRNEVLEDESSRPVGANLPALGLSNKAVFEGDIASMVEAQESEDYLSQQAFVSTGATPTSLIETMTQPPFEEHLLQHTLWPEVEKLFGHGYELMSTDPYRLIASNKAHARILWDCSWSADDSMFATGSRDKMIKIWAKKDVENSSSWATVATIKLPEAVTAVEFAPIIGNKSNVLAAGLEDGRIFLFESIVGAPETWSPLGEIKRELTHVGTVNGISWRLVMATKAGGSNNKLQLASCGVDHSVRLFNITIHSEQMR